MKYFVSIYSKDKNLYYYSKKIYRDLFPNVALTKQEELKYINNLEKIDTYIEEATNMLEYADVKKVKPW